MGLIKFFKGLKNNLGQKPQTYPESLFVVTDTNELYLNGNIWHGNNYSTDEVIVGKWINGENVYRRLIPVISTAAFAEAWQTRGIKPFDMTQILGGVYIAIGEKNTLLTGSFRVNNSSELQFYCRTYAYISPTKNDYMILTYLK
jgi:hypothetical protein